MMLIKLQAELREKEAKCKQLCTTDQIAILEQEKNQLESDRLRNAKNLEDLNTQAA